jgi:hypothetical protein
VAYRHCPSVLSDGPRETIESLVLVKANGIRSYSPVVVPSVWVLVTLEVQEQLVSSVKYVSSRLASEFVGVANGI